MRSIPEHDNLEKMSSAKDSSVSNYNSISRRQTTLHQQ